jgi:small-conductance mechanosensitive channel
LLLEVAAGHERVLKTKQAKVRLKNFGENGIDLELVLWIADPEEGEFNLRSDLNWAIWALFKRENIEIPFPQRVLHQASTQVVEQR